jgi:hypothetical protein
MRGHRRANLPTCGERLSFVEDDRLSRCWRPKRIAQLQRCGTAAATYQPALSQNAAVPNARTPFKDHATWKLPRWSCCTGQLYLSALE